ncbi:MAG: hypothetical protein Q7J59_03465 [Elusimicrobiota bacterium]|nr:hypothetical protein [Elusimicrobiota bacterium]
MRNYKLLFIAAIGVLAMGCDRMFKDSITFRGRVFYGIVSTSTIGNVVTIDSAANDAVVQVANHAETTKTDSSGNYTLSVEAYRSFTSSKADIYTIQAFAPRSAMEAVDEYTTVYGRPGDTVEVRPLVFTEITDEDKNF